MDTCLGRRLASLITAGRDRSARLWDLSDPHAVRPLGLPLVGQEEPVYTVAVSPDGRLAPSRRGRPAGGTLGPVGS